MKLKEFIKATNRNNQPFYVRVSTIESFNDNYIKRYGKLCDFWCLDTAEEIAAMIAETEPSEEKSGLSKFLG